VVNFIREHKAVLDPCFLELAKRAHLLADWMRLTSACCYAGRRNLTSAFGAPLCTNSGWPKAGEQQNICCTLVLQSASVLG
jgi:hypothetical protein